MKDLHENKLFYRSLQLCYAVLAIATLEVFPPLNDLLQLTTNSLSTDNDTFINESSVAFQQPIVSVWIRAVDFPIFMSLIMILDTVLSFSLERAIVRVFENT